MLVKCKNCNYGQNKGEDIEKTSLKDSPLSFQRIFSPICKVWIHIAQDNVEDFPEQNIGYEKDCLQSSVHVFRFIPFCAIESKN